MNGILNYNLKYDKIDVLTKQFCSASEQHKAYMHKQSSSEALPSLENKFIKLHVSLELAFSFILCVDMTNTYNLLVINNKQYLIIY